MKKVLKGMSSPKNRQFNYLILVVFLFFISTLSIAQGNVITGKVISEDGQPLPGVNILQKGTSNGVVSDFDGNYSLTLIDGNQTVIFSFLGFVTKEAVTTALTTDSPSVNA